MKFISITGPDNDIDRVINQYLSKYEIHLENPMLELKSSNNLFPYIESNPYKNLLLKGDELKKLIGTTSFNKVEDMDVQKAEHLIQDISNDINQLQKGRAKLKKILDDTQSDYDKISPFIDLKYDIDNILQFKHIDYSFGRIPIENYTKLQLYMENKNSSIFIKCKTDKQYVWGVYFVPISKADKYDAAYTSMHFERISLPPESNGTPKEACEHLQNKIDDLNTNIASIDVEINKRLEKNKESIFAACKKIQIAHENFDVRKMATHTRNDGSIFYIICGWMTEVDAINFQQEIETDDNVVCIIEGKKGKHRKSPPTKLKNPKIFKPFEMYIRMYGIPAYNEIDPTIFVALTYSFIFGAMFGDVGQGLILAIGGFLLYYFKKMNLAAIISSAGIFSTFFGFMFGSVFGFEDIIEPVWLQPVEAMTNVPFIGKLNTVLVVAIGFGMLLILFTMILHVINGFKNHEIEHILFDTNALAGLIFYGAIVVIIGLLMTGKSLPATIVLVIMFVIPLIIIALKEPLSHWINKTKPEEKTGVGMFITQTIFELFEILLSYFSNTLSFIRIGAFAITHVSMMEVVLMLAGAESGSPNLLVIILGNIFVIGMEGLIVGIQVLRLEYYELFSRFYKGTGREFKPFKAQK